MTLSPPEWVLRQLGPNFFSLKIGGEESWVHFLPFSGRCQLVDAGVYQYLSDTKIPLPRKEVAGDTCFSLPTQRLAIFHPPLFGSPIDFKKPEDCSDVIRFLAEFHIAMQGFVPDIHPHSTLGRLMAHWERRLARLCEFSRLAGYRIYPGVMDQEFLRHVDAIANGIKDGLDGLQRAGYQEICNLQGQICYFHFQSKFFWRNDDRVSPWHFAFCHWELPVFDLYRYIIEVGRRDFTCEQAYSLISQYHQIRPLSHDEKALLAVFFQFPERLYRLFSAFYLNRTARAPRSLMERVRREIRIIEERKKIIQKIGDVGEQ